jgi:uncharacterized protein YqhQ
VPVQSLQYGSVSFTVLSCNVMKLFSSVYSNRLRQTISKSYIKFMTVVSCLLQQWRGIVKNNHTINQYSNVLFWGRFSLNDSAWHFNKQDQFLLIFHYFPSNILLVVGPVFSIAEWERFWKKEIIHRVLLCPFLDNIFIKAGGKEKVKLSL